MHPLVLSLGLSESSLSTREGITWDDDDGELLAQRIDPSVRYLRKGYEKALLTYYVKLWIYHPQEMFDIYKNKFMNYKTFKIARSIKSKNVTFLNAPFLGMIVLFTYLVNTAWKAWFVLFSSIAMIAVFRGKMSTVGLFISTIVVGVCFLLLLESVIILHVYSATHLSVVNLLFFMIIFYYIQMLVSYLQINRFCRDLKIKNDSYLIRNFLEKQFNKTMKVFRFKP
jgi:hypothetical protein